MLRIAATLTLVFLAYVLPAMMSLRIMEAWEVIGK
jgi:hypothetical protein